jgi:hypothetical protein
MSVQTVSRSEQNSATLAQSAPPLEATRASARDAVAGARAGAAAGSAAQGQRTWTAQLGGSPPGGGERRWPFCSHNGVRPQACPPPCSSRGGGRERDVVQSGCWRSRRPGDRAPSWADRPRCPWASEPAAATARATARANRALASGGFDALIDW